MSDFRFPSWSAKNPLGIIALFISLIYGMSALLLGTSLKSLSAGNQTALVAFVIVFPFVVLWVFGWLVSRHHTKLYGPADYRSDAGFLNAGRTVSNEDVGRRLAKELASDSSSDKIDPKPQSSQSSTDKKALEVTITGGVGKSTVLARAYLIESLVFQALQAELGGSIRRDVIVNGKHIDGLVYLPDGTLTIVEVKMFSSNSIEVARRIREAKARLLEIKAAFQPDAQHSLKLLLALVVEGNPGRVSELKGEWSRLEGLAVRVYGFSELIEKYGLGDQTPRPKN